MESRQGGCRSGAGVVESRGLGTVKHRSCWRAAFVALAAASTVSAQESRRASSFHEFTLDNGLGIIVVENHLAPLATVLMAVRGGAAVQVPGEQGIAHLYEHVLFRAYGDSPGEFWAAASNLNAQFNGTTSHEVVTYYLMLPSENTEKGIQLLGRLLTRAKFRANDLAAERAVVLDELERNQSDPEQALVRDVSRHLWGNTWYRRDLGGDSLSLVEINVGRLMANYYRYYVPNNAALIVTGDVLWEHVLEAARRHLGNWERGGDPFADVEGAPIEELTGSRAAIMARDLQDVTIHIKLQGPSLQEDTAATYAADVLFELLDNSGSAFQRRLVGSGLFQSLGSSYLTLSETGPITFAGKVAVEDATDALVTLVAQIDSLDLLVGVTDEDLAIAKRRREVNAALALEATATLAPSLAFWWAGAGMDYYRTYHDRMNEQTLDDLRSFARRYLVNRPKMIGVLGPNAAMARIADWLRRSARNP